LKLDEGLNVVELGAGTGVVGLVAAALGYVWTNCSLEFNEKLLIHRSIQ
jgi:predicted RNA methylase